MTTLVALQQPQRLFRDGLTSLLAREADIDVVGASVSKDELVALCRQAKPAVALVDVAAGADDELHVLAALRTIRPVIDIVGLSPTVATPAMAVRARRGGVRLLVPRCGGIAGILAAIRTVSAGGPRPFPMDPSSTRSPRARSTMTDRELAVLHLVGAGFTSKEISGRLEISHKTVENHKQRIFAKLGVQNQAHAVSVAIRAGLLRPNRAIDLAVGG
ncbi:MAG TPA: response regulator transcription factor [Acidimicrobiales bacterium]|nr:response regulator transcription factor [Acidimicrobiales bacterium]